MSTKNIIFFNPRGNLEEYIRLLNLDNLKPESQNYKRLRLDTDAESFKPQMAQTN